MTDPDPAQEKRRFRAELRAESRLHANVDSAQAADAAAARLACHWPAPALVGLFAPARGELPVAHALQRRWPHTRFAYPRSVDEHQFVLVECAEPPTHLGRWRVPEPPAMTPALEELPTLLLVPGVAFTLAGTRLGRGGGHYDRFLQLLPGSIPLVGVCYDWQLKARLPREAHDLPMSHLLTEARFVTCPHAHAAGVAT